MYDLSHEKYFTEVRKELLELIPFKNRSGKLLEVGAAGGDTLVFAKKHGYAQEVYGVELFELDNTNQKNDAIERLIIGNIEEIELPFEENFFDVILLPDVLEHLIDPYRVLALLKKFLKDDGVVIASIPNIRYYEVLKQIVIGGSFAYSEAGIMDRTHLRFFCRKDMIKMFEDAGFELNDITSAYEQNPPRKKNLLNKLCLNKLTEFFVFQYFIVARKHD